MVEIATITREEFRQIIEVKPLVVIPVGSIEQHGPHCPLGTDSLIAQTIAQDACTLTGTLCAPPVFIALSEHHKGFSGTLWVSYQSFFNYLLDICKSLSYQGAEKLIFVNSHGGNTSAITNLCSTIRTQLNLNSLIYQWWAPPTHTEHIFKAEAIHADGIETSMVAAIDSDLVNMAEFNQIDPNEVPSRWGQRIEGRLMPLYTHEFSPTGIAGQIHIFSVEKGKELKEAVIQDLSTVIQEFLDFDLPEFYRKKK